VTGGEERGKNDDGRQMTDKKSLAARKRESGEAGGLWRITFWCNKEKHQKRGL